MLTMVWLAADVALGSALIARVGYAASLAAAAAMSSGGREPYAATLPLRLFLAGALFAFPGFASDAAAVFVLLPVSTLALRWAAATAKRRGRVNERRAFSALAARAPAPTRARPQAPQPARGGDKPGPIGMSGATATAPARGGAKAARGAKRRRARWRPTKFICSPTRRSP